MKTRILTALVGIPLVLLLLFWPGGIPWLIGVAAVTAVAIYEYTVTLRLKDIWAHWFAIALYAVAILLLAGWYPFLAVDYWKADSLVVDVATFLLAWNPASGHIGPVLVVALLLIGDLAWHRRAPLRNVGATLLGIAYIPGLLSFLVLLRAWGLPDRWGRMPGWMDPGAWAMLCVLLVVWSVDSGAYFVGRAYGKHKLAPAISPNKTWEGVFGGLAAASLAGAIATFPLFGWLGLTYGPAARIGLGLAFGFVVGGMGIIGDLVKSAMKREVGVKDFGTLLPGHGGILDRFDSLLYATPTAYLLLYLFSG